MPGLFTDLRKQLSTAQRAEEKTLVEDRIYEELDRLRDMVMRGGTTAPGPSANNSTNFKPFGTPITNQPSGTIAREDSALETFELAAASGEIIVPDQSVSVRLDPSGISVAYLADASNAARRADGLCVGVVYRGGERRLVCAKRRQARVRMASGAMPTVGAELFVSALVPGALTDNPSESSTRKFSQRVGTYLYQAKNALGELQDGVAWADVDYPPAASLPAAASA